MQDLDVACLSPTDLRSAIRRGEWRGPTAGLAPDYAQANLVILPRDLAFDFLRFCQRNPKPCPVLEVLDAGDPEPKLVAPGADLRTDVPRYRLFHHGELIGERDDVTDLWQPDMVAFLLGCSFTFDAILLRTGLPVRHIEEARNVPMYRPNRECVPAGPFHGPLVVSMRPIPAALVDVAARESARYPAAHGGPIHVGDPSALGITDLSRPDFGDNVTIREDEVPVFWACGVTPQAVAVASRPSLMITHAPGHMFVTDLPASTLAAG